MVDDAFASEDRRLLSMRASLLGMSALFALSGGVARAQDSSQPAAMRAPRPSSSAELIQHGAGMLAAGLPLLATGVLGMALNEMDPTIDGRGQYLVGGGLVAGAGVLMALSGLRLRSAGISGLDNATADAIVGRRDSRGWINGGIA